MQAPTWGPWKGSGLKLILDISAYLKAMRRSVFWLLLKLQLKPLLVLLFCLSTDLTAQHSPRGDVCFVWYNPENLFHPEDDSLAGDDEFTPQGPRHWTWSRYRQKITALAKVIIAAGRGEAPELVGLCEVENALVLKDLVRHPILAPYDYVYFHQEGEDHRGMELACLCRTGRLECVHWECVPFSPPLTATRDMMHLMLSWGEDTLDLFLVHLLSKYRGAGATAELRRVQTEQLVSLMDSVYQVRSRGLLLAAGDFNEEYGSYSLEPLRSARFGADSLSYLKPEHGNASYKYRGRWIAIDQVLASSSLEPCLPGVNILQLPPLFTDDQRYGGIKPSRSYEGYLYRGGISDHLPLVVHLFDPKALAPDGP